MYRAHARAWLSEFTGTTIMLFAAALTARWLDGPHSALATTVSAAPGRTAITGVVIGAVVGLLIISPLGRSSGGHFNPAVTVTFWLLRALPGRDAIAYVVAQLAGSLAGVALGWAVLGAAFADPPVSYAVIQPAAGWSGTAVFLGEAISVAVMMAFVVAFMDRPTLARWTPAVVAAAIAVLIFVGGLTSGGSFNPARQLGPLVFAGRFSYLWAYLLGPLAGAVILAVVAGVVRLPRPLTCSLCGTPPRGTAPEPVSHPAGGKARISPAGQASQPEEAVHSGPADKDGPSPRPARVALARGSSTPFRKEAPAGRESGMKPPGSRRERYVQPSG